MKVLITGTARGIGRACALRYLEAGHEVVGFDIRESTVFSDRYTHYIVDITKELPEIGKRIPEMISGPYYKGVWSIEMGRKILHFSCECLEQHSRVVRRKLNHDVIVLLESNGYKL